MKIYYSDSLKKLVTIPEEAGDDPQPIANVTDDEGLPFRVVAISYPGKEREK